MTRKFRPPVFRPILHLFVAVLILLWAATVSAAESDLVYPEAMTRGRVAFAAKQYEAAYLYFAHALSLNPSSQEARDTAARALYYAKRFPSKRGVSVEDLKLPPLSSDLEEELNREMERKYAQGGLVGPDKKPEIPFGDEKAPEDEPEGEGRDWIRPQDRPRAPVPEEMERPEIVRPGLTTVLGIKTRLSLAPLSTGRNSLFHALIHIPPFEGVRTLDEKVWFLSTGYEYCTGSLESGNYGPTSTDLVLRYDNNMFHDAYLRLAHGLLEGLELRLTINASNLREGGGDVVLTDVGTSPWTQYIPDYDRRLDIGNLIASVKWNFFRTLSQWPADDPESGLTGIFDLKVPLARNPRNFTSSGGVDLACSLVASLYLGRIVFFPFMCHASAGVTLPLGQHYFQHDVDLDPVFHFALGADLKFAGWGAVIGQILGNTSAFTEFEPLSGMVLSTQVGLRLMIGHFFMETSIGFPLSESASTFTFTLHFGLHFMGREREEEILT
jgi:hypothetical protein